MNKFTDIGTLIILSLVIAVFSLCPSSAGAGERISITGSTTALPVAQRLAEVYMEKYPEINISVAGTGSGDGIRAIIDGSADIGTSSRDMKGKEVALALEKGIKPVKQVIALDCIVPVVSLDNPVTDLKVEQLRMIYNGKIKNWQNVGGHDKQIVAVSRDSSSGTFEVWQEKILNKDKVRPDAQLQASNGAVAQAVAGNKYAIGYLGIGYLNSNLKALKVNGVTASFETTRTKVYHIYRELLVFTRDEPTGPVKAFLDFVNSPKGRKIVREEGFVAIN
ncbi:MAG: phosphate ABC transporter substrate-binding protein [Deltaproteobacteria bacterium]|nr:phosphate ABC transporter substrate-binding protein [Deltaproteobacteria bacterium]